MIIFQGVKKIWSGHETLMDRQMDGQTDGRTDGQRPRHNMTHFTTGV